MIAFRAAITLLLLVAVLVSGCVIGDGERDYAMSHITPTDAQSSLITPAAIPIPSTPTPPSLYWIKIDPISDKQVGEIFTINSTTNLSAGDEIHVAIYQAEFSTGTRSSGGEFLGIIGTVKVMPGKNEINTISFIVNSSELYPDPRKYVITEMAFFKDSAGVEQSNATGEALFNITPRKIP
jgi:hypothetical protein